jgi:hypothetical protein
MIHLSIVLQLSTHLLTPLPTDFPGKVVDRHLMNAKVVGEGVSKVVYYLYNFTDAFPDDFVFEI